MSKALQIKTPYRYKRYYTFALFTIIGLSLPFIRIDGNHFFLLSFDHKQLHLFFTRFDMQEMYLMPFLLIFLFLGVFFLTTLGGRVWCGWACPQTIFRVIYRDLIQTKLLGIRKSIQNKQEEPEGQVIKKAIAILIWSFLALLASANFLWYFVPPEDFFEYLKNPSEHIILVGALLSLTAFLIYDIVKLKEDFCIYVCPYARVQSVMYDEETIQTIYNTHRGGKIYDEHNHKLVKNLKELKQSNPDAECTYCESCVKVCPTHIDIKMGTQLECINCLECADACTKVMGALNKPSLITWTSLSAVKDGRQPKFFRMRTVAYGIALLASVIALFWMGSTKEYMLLNINRSTQLYKIKDNGTRVVNAYKFLFQNTDNKDHEYYFEIKNNPDIVIERPKEPFLVSAGQKIQKIVVLSTTKVLTKDNTKDTLFPIEIVAYAVDDKEKIKVTRKTIFAYPRYDILLQHKKE